MSKEAKPTYEMLEDLIRADLTDLLDSHEALGALDLESEKVDQLIKLYRLKIDEDKSSWDAQEQLKAGKAERRGRWIDYGFKAMEIGLGVGSLIFYGYFLKAGFQFEEKGSISSFTFKEAIRSFRPFKKIF